MRHERAGSGAFHSTDHWLVSGAVEVSVIGDIVSGARTLVAHEALEKVVFLYLLDGQAAVRLSDVGDLTLTKDEVLVIFPGRVLTVELTAPSNRLMAVTLTGREAVRAALGLGYFDLMRATEHYEGNYMAEIIDLFHASPMRGRDERVLSQVEHLLRTVWLRARHGGDHGASYDALRTLNQRICAGECLSTEAAAEALEVSRSKLNALFMDGFGFRPGEYISRTLTALAQAMLFWTNVSVAKVAAELGFSSVSAFATFLRRRIGRTPAEFRKKPIALTSENTDSL